MSAGGFFDGENQDQEQKQEQEQEQDEDKAQELAENLALPQIKFKSDTGLLDWRRNNRESFPNLESRDYGTSVSWLPSHMPTSSISRAFVL